MVDEGDKRDMGRSINRLSNRAVQAKKKPGRYADGGGLYLQVQPGGSKTFLFMKVINGKRKTLGLGPYPDVSLSDARDKAVKIRNDWEHGELALVATKTKSLSAAYEAVSPPVISKTTSRAITTFGDFSKEWMDKNLVGLSNPKSRQQWYNTLRDYAKPIKNMSIDSITTQHVLNCLTPIWQTKPETARRVQQRIERILAAAKVLGYREGENPAQWKYNLDLVLPNMRSVRKHHAAMPYLKVPEYFQKLQSIHTLSSLSLQFIILTAARSTEGRGARWDEISLQNKIWTIPPERMKARKEHRVPLSSTSIGILETSRTFSTNDYVFSSFGKARYVSEAAVRKLKKETRAEDCTIHGFRSSFRDWAGNATTFPRELAEEALAHQLGSVEAAYRREQAVERRREMMEAWANFLGADID